MGVPFMAGGLDHARACQGIERAARLTTAQITAALRPTGRRGDLAQRARDIRAALRTAHLAQPAVVTEAYAASVRASAAVVRALNEQVKAMEARVSGLFRRHPDARIYLSRLATCSAKALASCRA